MAVEIAKQNWDGQVKELTIGATEEEGGTRTSTVTVGGETTLPFLHFEGEIPNKPVVALEILDEEPGDWPEPLAEVWGDVWDDPAKWAKKCVEEYDAELIALRLTSADPIGQDRSAEEIAETVEEVLDAVGVPLILIGCGDEEKDNEILKAAAEAAEGENLLIGFAEEENHSTIAAACMVHDHNVIAQSPVDMNICKQLNILLTDMKVKTNQIVIDPLVSSLGYGMEYSYSVMERIRLGALRDDDMLAMPMINFIGEEAWDVKETQASEEEKPGWGEWNTRGIQWETAMGTTVLQGGADILVARHPEAKKNIEAGIEELMTESSYE